VPDRAGDRAVALALGLGADVDQDGARVLDRVGGLRGGEAGQPGPGGGQEVVDGRAGAGHRPSITRAKTKGDPGGPPLRQLDAIGARER
jgi:hypothetical protein